MADTKLTSLTELAAKPADDDLLYLVDVSDTTDDATGSSRKLKAKRFATTDGSAVTFTGGGSIALGGYTLTAPATGTLLTLAHLLTVDGAGSGVDADLLDGVQLSAIQAYMLGQTLKMLSVPYSADYAVLGVTYNGGAASAIYLNASNIPSSLKVYLYVLVGVSGASTAYARLYNETTAAAISGSEVTNVFGTADFTWLNSGDIRANLTAGLNRYILQLKNSSAGQETYSTSAMLVITP